MENQTYDKSVNEFLFSFDCIDGTYDPKEEERRQKARELVEQLGWTVVLSEWTEYLRCQVKSRKEAFNFATWVLIYDGDDCNAKNPYPFLALLYHKLELDTDVKDELDERFDDPWQRFTDLYYGMIVASGMASLEDSEFMNPDRDPKLMAELKKLGWEKKR